MIKLSDYVINFVADLGVKNIFMLPGGGCMHLVDSVGRHKDIEFIGTLHEQAAVIAADGYAQYKNDIGVALVTTGPGGTNTITGVTASWIDSTPLLVLSGQVKRKDMLQGKGIRQMGIQEVDIIPLVKPITKYAVTVLEPDSIRYHLEKAIYLAMNGRPGPVWIDIPLDVQAAIIDEETLSPFDHYKFIPSSLMGEDAKFIPPPQIEMTGGGEGELWRFSSETQHGQDILMDNCIEETISLLNESERPVILAGRGIRLGHAEEEFLKVIETLKIPVLTTWRIMDILSEDNELYFGRPGSIASRGANFVQQNADFILTIGARLDLPQVGHSYPNFARNAKKIIVDIDPAEINKIDSKVDVTITADSKKFLSEFYNKIAMVRPKDRTVWLSKCREWKGKYPVILPEYLEPAKYVNTYALIDVLSEISGSDDVIVPGSSGSCAEITCQAFRIKKGQRLLNSPGLGSMGFGLPQSIGACVASGRRTICIIGDGGLQHNIQELETLKRLNIPVKIFVLNNNGYAAIRNTHKRFFDGRLVCCDPSSGLTLPDTCRIASAYGLKTVRILNQNNLVHEVSKILDMDGPVVCDVMIDTDMQMAPRLSSSARPDGAMVSKPLEDLWPFLDRDEFAANMIIPLLKEG
ncbi:MAG: thiamine pyrophosphate-binding protein [Nitrospirae bacterium]|nr:thiamine pyrophosphate-binding protein [Nitrospirota bacterium]